MRIWPILCAATLVILIMACRTESSPNSDQSGDADEKSYTLTYFTIPD